MPQLEVITGAFGYTGGYITRLLLAKGYRVRSLTGHPQRRNPFGDQVEVALFNFDKPAELVKSLEGADTLFNTYWIRFAYGELTFDKAVANTRILIDAAKRAGVRKFVHVSITNPSETSPLPYFKGKALLEKSLIESGLSYSIIRPTVIFGLEDILINNIAWLLRRFPVFAIPGTGEYQLQPIYVEDMAALSVETSSEGHNRIIDAIGPETYSFNDLVRMIARIVDSRAAIVHLPPSIALAAATMLGWIVRDVMLTPDEVRGLMANLLVTNSEPVGRTRLSEWLAQHANQVGIAYASELAKHYR